MKQVTQLRFAPLSSLIEPNGTRYIASGSPKWGNHTGWVDRDNVNTGLHALHPEWVQCVKA